MKKLITLICLLPGLLFGANPSFQETTNVVNAIVNPVVNNAITNNQFVFADNSTISYWQVVKRLFTTNGALDRGGLRVSTCSFDKDGYIRLYYAGYTNDLFLASVGGHVIMYSGKTWDSLARYGVVLERGASGKWDSGNIGSARIFNFGDATNYLYYFAGSNTSFETGWQSVGVAFTTDGTNFTRYTSNAPLFDVGDAGSWNANANQGGVWVMKRDGRYIMYFSGMDAPAGDESIGMAFASHPLGPWTTNASNPVLDNPAGIAVEPNILKLADNKGYAMVMGAGVGHSYDLTNWNWSANNTIQDPLGLRIHPSYMLSPFCFYDNGLCALWDDTLAVYLLRPAQAQVIIYNGASITNLVHSTRLTSSDTNKINLTISTNSNGQYTYNLDTSNLNTNGAAGGGTNIYNYYVQSGYIIEGLDGCGAAYNGTPIVPYGFDAWGPEGYNAIGLSPLPIDTVAPFYLQLGGDGGNAGQWYLFVSNAPYAIYTNAVITGSNLPPVPSIVGTYELQFAGGCGSSSAASIREFIITNTIDTVLAQGNNATLPMIATNNANQFGGTFTGNGTGLTNITLIGGASGTNRYTLSVSTVSNLVLTPLP